ncbi:MAG: hypothetical protein EAZ97_00850 [Bacteroidetes bacterium]|nr:MAG: hypothetical protein EAZ97_00850 [Bacteroidota bacterium]
MKLKYFYSQQIYCLLFIFFCFFCQFNTFAQSKMAFNGKVVDENGKVLADVKITANGQYAAISNSKGEFELLCPAETKISKLEANKAPFSLAKWGYQKSEIRVVMQSPLRLLEGHVVDQMLEAVKGAQISIQGTNFGYTFTNKNGDFVLPIPYEFNVNSNTKFMIDNYSIEGNAGYSAKENYVYLKLGEKKTDMNKKPDVTLSNLPSKDLFKAEEANSVDGVKILFSGNTYISEKKGKYAIKIPEDENESWIIDGLMKENYSKNKNYIEIVIDRETKTGNKTIYNKTPSNLTFDELLTELSRKKDENKRINHDIEEIAHKILSKENLDSLKREGLEDYMGHLEKILVENNNEYEDAKNKTNALIKEVLTVVDTSKLAEERKGFEETKKSYEKAISVLDSANLAEKEVLIAMENEFKQNLTIFAIVAGILLLIAYFSFIVARSIREQKNNLVKVNKQLEITQSQLVEQIGLVNEQKAALVLQSEKLQILNREVTAKNQKITDSIRYAQTIQTAILPSNRILGKGFRDYFVLYRPKDIVSGDFYWYAHLPEVNKSFIAAVDCTGHGVSGAFMSMIGNSVLNEIVNQNAIYEPAMILTLLDKGIREALRQEERTNDDGMDVCLCLLEKYAHQQSKLTFTGAKRPLFYWDNKDKKINVLKGDLKSIGGVKKKSEKQFTNQEIILRKGDILYMTSDGFIDQSNQEGAKIGTNRFVELLGNINNLPMIEQQNIFEKTLDEHMNGAEQRDDIMLIGIKI